MAARKASSPLESAPLCVRKERHSAASNLCPTNMEEAERPNRLGQGRHLFGTEDSFLSTEPQTCLQKWKAPPEIDRRQALMNWTGTCRRSRKAPSRSIPTPQPQRGSECTEGALPFGTRMCILYNFLWLEKSSSASMRLGRVSGWMSSAHPFRRGPMDRVESRHDLCLRFEYPAEGLPKRGQDAADGSSGPTAIPECRWKGSIEPAGINSLNLEPEGNPRMDRRPGKAEGLLPSPAFEIPRYLVRSNLQGSGRLQAVQKMNSCFRQEKGRTTRWQRRERQDKRRSKDTSRRQSGTRTAR